MQAKNVDQYRDAWTSHINQIGVLALAADVEYHHYLAIKRTLTVWLEKAIETQNFNQKETEK